MATSYYRVMLGRGSVFAQTCFDGGFIGCDFEIKEDLQFQLPDDWREFNKKFIPYLLEANPERSRVSAGLSCGSLWNIAKGIRIDDVVLSPDGKGTYHVCKVTGDYYYLGDQDLPHRRKVNWFTTIARTELSQELRNATGSIGTVANVSRFAEELEQLIATGTLPSPPRVISTDPEVEDPTAFALESHLQEFLVENWDQTSLGKEFKIYEEAGERIGDQYPTDTGPLDILAVSRDGSRLLVVELKKGKAADVAVGQILRYMGFVKDELAASGQKVEGIIIGLDDDKRVRRALSILPDVHFYRYKIEFNLVPADAMGPEGS